MEVYNENEQVAALKNFLASNGKVLIAGIVLSVGALAGWRYWVNHQSSTSQLSSERYYQLSNELDASNPQAIEKTEAFVTENSNAYGALASLRLAKVYADKNQLDKAAVQLENGLRIGGDDNLQAIMSLRLARIQLQQKQADKALKSLEAVKGEGWQPLKADLRGDILFSQGDVQGAKQAWSEGIDADAASAGLKSNMQMKINNLG